MKPAISNIQFVFDVESIGLHGEPYAVAFTVWKDGSEVDRNIFSCPPELVHGDDDDRDWCRSNIPPIPVSHSSIEGILSAFWEAWMRWKKEGAQMFAECSWPVEAKFLAMCIGTDYPRSKWDGPYPIHEIASFMAAAGMDPMASYPYENGEVKHNPLSDARQSARLLHRALATLPNEQSAHHQSGHAAA